MMNKDEYIVKDVPKYDPPSVTFGEVKRPDWAVDAEVSAMTPAVAKMQISKPPPSDANFSVSKPNPVGAPSPDLRMQTFRPKAPAPAAAPPPPPPEPEPVVVSQAEAPAKSAKPPKPMKPPKKTQAAPAPAPAPALAPAPNSAPASAGPVVPKRPARFSRPVGKETNTSAAPAAAPGSNPMAQSANGRFYALSQLQDKNNCPPNVDPKTREMFLSDLDFMGVFGMTKEQYKTKAAWQQVVLKKKANLF